MTLTETRAQWRHNSHTDRNDWKTSPDQHGNEGGECRGEFVISDGFPYQAYLKPGKIGQKAWAWPMPAYEKITADLAYDLDCPVPVVQIWEQEEGKTGEYACYSSLSLKEFPRKYPWGACRRAFTDAERAPGATDIFIPLARAALARTSGMLVIDTLLGQADRGDHENNIALSYDPADPGRAQFTFFDFGRALNWNGQWANDSWKNIAVTQQPQLMMNNIDRRMVRSTYEKLMDSAKFSITHPVGRLSGMYFTDADFIATCLLERRKLLKPIIEPYM